VQLVWWKGYDMRRERNGTFAASSCWSSGVNAGATLPRAHLTAETLLDVLHRGAWSKIRDYMKWEPTGSIFSNEIWMDQSLHEAFIRYKVILADIEGIRIVDEESETIVPDIEY